MKIDLEGADAYFSIDNHVNGPVWLRFRPERREGAIAQARRMFEQDLGRPMRETGAEGDARRDDLAVYEQALWLLLGAPYGDGQSGDAVAVLQGTAKEEEARKTAPRRPRWSEDALRWLGWTGQVMARA